MADEETPSPPASPDPAASAAATSSRAEHGAKLRVQLSALIGTGKAVAVYLLALIIFAIYIGFVMGVKAFNSGIPEDTLKFFDYLSYLMPSLAAIVAGYAVFSEPLAKPFFAFACVSLALGLGFYLAAHQIKSPTFASFLTVFLLLPWVELVHQTLIYKWKDHTTQWVVWFGIAVLLTCIVLVLPAVFRVGLS